MGTKDATVNIQKRNELADKAHTLIRDIEKKTIEREELARIITLSIFSKSHIFLIGVPGVGKTYVIEIAVRAVTGAKFFEYLVAFQTKLEELFGSVFTDKDGVVQYDTEGTMIDSHFVVLDEMFKANSQLLNSLLGVTSNERAFFMKGRGRIKVPLVTLFGAANEFPADDALEPFDDRLLLRYEVERIKDPVNYKRFIEGDFDRSKEVSVSLTLDDIEYATQDATCVDIPEEIVNLFVRLKQAIVQDRIKVSDRKMITSMHRILKMSAYLNKRDEVDYSDIFLMKHIAWRDFTERQKINEVLNGLIFGHVREVVASINETVDKLNSQKKYLDGVVGDFVYKRKELDTKNLEKEYNEHYSNFKVFFGNISAIAEIVNSLLSHREFVLKVEAQIRRNFLTLDIHQDVYSQESSNKLFDLKDNLESILYICNTVEQHAKNAYDYISFVPGLHYATF